MKTENLIIKIVNRYIGVSGGYLGNFTYRTHQEFYPEYCDLIKNPDSIEGTTRERFITIFQSSTSKEQSKIIRGVVEKFPLGEGPKTRTKELQLSLLEEAEKLDTFDYLKEPKLLSADHVLEILEDAKSLIENRKAVSAVDRIHTAFHGYLREVCRNENINFIEKDDLVVLVKKIFSEHSKLKIMTKATEVQNIVRNLASIANSLNPVRNQGSRAHPNVNVLEEPEAILVINKEKEKIIKVSQEHYGKPVLEIEEKIMRWSGLLDEEDSASAPREKEEFAARPAAVSNDAKPLYDAVCSRCGRDIQVSFIPDPKRPVYCKDCLAKVMREREARQSDAGETRNSTRRISLNEAVRKFPSPSIRSPRPPIRPRNMV